MPSSSSYLSTADFAALFGMTADRVVDLIHAGQLKAVNIATSLNAKRPTWRISQQERERFEQVRQSTHPIPDQKRRRKPTAEVIEFY